MVTGHWNQVNAPRAAAACTTLGSRSGLASEIRVRQRIRNWMLSLVEFERQQTMKAQGRPENQGQFTPRDSSP
ncbi:MAG: hypothetical protein KGL48_16105 [Sphingomonadales bacterium]|nr:hypothetical protein [Sphingomonadales bacterium]MDE2569125.1 hypothetical protein [Sphingomonadales bacterium]